MKIKSKAVKLMLITTLLLITLIGCGNTDKKETELSNVVNMANTEEKESEAEETISDNSVKTVVQPERELTLTFVGDCTLGRFKGMSYEGSFDEYYDTNGPDFFFENVKEIFEKDDFTVINLEGPLTDLEATANKQFPISCLSEHVEVLTNSSVEVANLANNHIRDAGEQGFEDTKQILTENKIGYFGENNIYVTEKNGIRIGFAGYRGFLINDDLREQIKSDIEYIKAEQEAQIAVVVFHYGIERENYSNSEQEGISRYAVDTGADIVIGGHPHVMQGIEIYNGKTICYSLGNFSFGANKNPKDKDTFIYQQTFSLNENNEVEYKEHTVIPCRISSRTDWNDYKPTPLHNEDYERVISRLKEYSSKYETSIFDVMESQQ